ncbi:hypothetical protein [Streptomyces sp. NPDC126514]|uniref:hypothetical protein n=1 Tax=Streptomyces sp. NPDC126514 TaxID=3155210 RepID=UPI003328B6F6
MESGLQVALARGATRDPSDWAWIAAIFALYLLIGYGLEYRSRSSRGAACPAKAAGLFSEREGIDPCQRFVSRMTMLCGGLATGLACPFTRNTPTMVQYLTVSTVALLGIFTRAYYDHRTEPRGDPWAQRPDLLA